MRIVVGGQVVEDIDYHNRVHEMMELQTSSDNRLNEAVEGLGQRIDQHKTHAAGDYNGIPGGGTRKRTVMFKPLSGLFDQSKYLPIKHMPISLELELVDSDTDQSVSASATAFPTPSTNWPIVNVQAKRA
jgi:hypothetical protein